MEHVPLVRLLSMAVTATLDELHSELAHQGHPTLRPVHGYALNAVENGHDTAGAIAPLLAMTKQGAAKLVQHLIDEGYLAYGSDSDGDARRKPLVLTPRGREAVELSVQIQDRIEQEWIDLAGERRVATTRRVLEQAVTATADGAPPAVRLGW